MQHVKIDVVSDTVCPWCFVGKRRLDAAMAKYPSVNFQVRWKPYQLDRDAPKEGISKLELYRKNFGEERLAQMTPRMTKTFKELGLVYSVGGLTGNTMDSHRLIHFAEESANLEVQNALVEELFLNYFTQEKFINSREVLLAAADKVGLIGAAEYLDNEGNGVEDVEDLMSLSMMKGVKSVPNLTFADKVCLSGAQSTKIFIDSIAKCLA